VRLNNVSVKTFGCIINNAVVVGNATLLPSLLSTLASNPKSRDKMSMASTHDCLRAIDVGVWAISVGRVDMFEPILKSLQACKPRPARSVYTHFLETALNLKNDVCLQAIRVHYSTHRIGNGYEIK
jgi:hypothetical protein